MSPIDRFVHDEDGAVAVIVALCLVVILSFTALGVDTASLYRDRARLQAAGDMAALSAMAEPSAATARAQSALVRNGHDAGDLAGLQTGRFLRNPALPHAQRFTPLPAGSPGINAVALDLTRDAPIHFARIFSDGSHVPLTRAAMATRTGAASFTLDSHIARLGATTLDDALEDALAVSISLSAGDVDVLAEARFDLADLLEAAAPGDDRNPAAVLNRSVTVARLIGALQGLVPGQAATLLSPLLSAQGSVDVATLVGGIDADLGLTATEFLSEIEISALDILHALVAARATSHSVEVAATVPGLIAVDATLTTGAPPASSGWVALGEEGVTLHRAAATLDTDLTLSPDLLGALGLGVSIAEIELPVITELAGATATLDEISCAGFSPADEIARFTTAPTLLDPLNGTSVAALYLGALQMPAPGAPIDPATLDFADLLTLSLTIDLPLLPDVVIPGIVIQARSHTNVGASQSRTISFTRQDWQTGATTKTFSSGALLQTATHSLLSPSRTELRVKPGQEGLVAGLAAPLFSTLMAALPDRLAADLTAPLDAALDAALGAAGLHLGEGALTLTGHHCETLQLVR